MRRHNNSLYFPHIPDAPPPLVAPIVQMCIDYHSPLSFHEKFTITASLHWAEAVRLNFQHLITGQDDRVAVTGYTIQLLTNLKREVLLARQEFVEDFCRR